MNGSFEAVHHGANDVHADAAPGHFGHFLGGAETRFENQIEGVLLVQALCFFGFDDSLFDSARANESQVDATAIVADFDDDLRALMIGIEVNGAARGLSNGQAFIGGTHAMIYSVADKMHERLGESVEDALVKVSVLPGKFQRDIFSALFCNVSNNARKAAKELLDGHHAN